MAVQGHRQWKMRRVGKATASRIFAIVDLDSRGKYKASRANLMHELAIEEITQEPTAFFVNQFMADGTRQEPYARTTYALENDVDVEQIEFVDHPTIPHSGASPDGLVPPDGLIEIKSPQLKTHVEYMLSETVPPEYLVQIHWQFACMPERKWCDFISYCEKMPPEGRMWVKRVPRDDAFVKRLEDEVTKFVSELETLTTTLRQRLQRAG